MSNIKPLYVALVSMFLQQSFATMAKIVVPIIAAVAFPALGVEATNVGIFTGFYSLCQVIIVLFCGNLIRRYGGLRMSQVGLFSILIGMTVATSGTIWAFALTAIFVSFGVSVSTPASSQILSRYLFGKANRRSPWLHCCRPARALPGIDLRLARCLHRHRFIVFRIRLRA